MKTNLIKRDLFLEKTLFNDFTHSIFDFKNVICFSSNGLYYVVTNFNYINASLFVKVIVSNGDYLNESLKEIGRLKNKFRHLDDEDKLHFTCVDFIKSQLQLQYRHNFCEDATNVSTMLTNGMDNIISHMILTHCASAREALMFINKNDLSYLFSDDYKFDSDSLNSFLIKTINQS